VSPIECHRDDWPLTDGSMVQLLVERGYLSGFDCDPQSVNVYGAGNLAPCWKTKKSKISYTLLTPIYTPKGVTISYPYGISTNAVFDQINSQESRGSRPVKEYKECHTLVVW
jgi:hypothetical protein